MFMDYRRNVGALQHTPVDNNACDSAAGHSAKNCSGILGGSAVGRTDKISHGTTAISVLFGQCCVTPSQRFFKRTLQWSLI